jgi:hypothetical protein
MPGVPRSASKGRLTVPLGPLNSRVALLPSTVPSWLAARFSTVAVMSMVIRSLVSSPSAGFTT